MAFAAVTTSGSTRAGAAQLRTVNALAHWGSPLFTLSGGAPVTATNSILVNLPCFNPGLAMVELCDWLTQAPF